MKKIKLIAPILGAAATLGTAIPLAACQEQGTAVEVTASAYEGKGVVVVTSNLPKSSEGKDFNATITWKHLASEAPEAEEYAETYLYEVKVWDESAGEGQKPKEITLDEKDKIDAFSYGKFSIKIQGEKVTSKISIEFKAKKVDDNVAIVPESDDTWATCDKASAEKKIKGYDLDGAWVDVSGATTGMTKLTDQTTSIEFVIPVKLLQDAFSKANIKTPIKDETSLHLFFETSAQRRSNPWNCGGVKLRHVSGETEKDIEITASFSGTYYGLTLPLTAAAKEAIATNPEAYEIVGWYNYSIDFAGTNLNGGRVCIYPHSEIAE